MVTSVAVEVSVIRAPPAGAVVPRKIEQVEDDPGVRLVGLHIRVETVAVVAEVVMVSEAVFVTEPAVALMIAVCEGAVLAVVTLNPMDVAFAGTVTEAGIVTPVAAVERLTGMPLAAAVELIDTVQVEELPAVRLVGLQVRLESTGAFRAMAAVVEEPLKEAVTIAF